jgi:hypothetical protein
MRTPFTNSKLSEQQLWFLLGCWLGQISPRTHRQARGLSYPTIHRWYVWFSQLLLKLQARLSGTIEVDKAFIGKKPYGNQTVVLGVIE